MSDIWTAVFTPVANQATALAIAPNSVSFAAYCTNVAPDGNGEWLGTPSPMWCFGAGLISPAARAAHIAAQVANPSLYWDVLAPTATATMLANHPNGPMFRYIPPEV